MRSILISVLVCTLILTSKIWSAVPLHNTGDGKDPAVIHAMELMKQAHEIECNGDYKSSIDIWKEAVTINPKLYVNYPDDKMNLHAMAGLANAYFYSGDYQNALPAFELAQQYIEEFDKSGESMLPWYISECRKKLAVEGELESEPLAIISNRLMRNGSVSANGSLLVSVSEAVRLLHLNVKADLASKSVALSAQGDSQKSIKLTAMVKTALADGKSLSLPTSPVMKGKELMVPLRAVAEYFGYKVKWDPMPKVAWVQ